MSGNLPILEFDTDDPEFSRGVEVGRLWEMLKTGEALEQTIRAANTEMAIRMLEATGRTFTAQPADEEWTFLVVEATG